MPANVLDHGVDHSRAPAGVLAADEQPVLGSELGRTDTVLHSVVVQFDLATLCPYDGARPLSFGVGERFAKRSFG